MHKQIFVNAGSDAHQYDSTYVDTGVTPKDLNPYDCSIVNIDGTYFSESAPAVSYPLNILPSTITKLMPLQLYHKPFGGIGATATGLTSSIPFRVQDIVKATKIPWTSGNVQTTSFTPTGTGLPSSKNIGDEFIIRLIITTPGTATPDKYTYTYVAQTDTYTLANVLDGLVASINLGTVTHGVSVSSNNTVLSFTGSSNFVTYRIAYDGMFTPSAIVYTTAKPGTGDHEQIAAIEEECFSKAYGVTQKTTFPIKVPTPVSTMLAATVTKYTTYIFDMQLPNLDKSNQGNLRSAPYKLILVDRYSAQDAEMTGALGYLLYTKVVALLA